MLLVMVTSRDVTACHHLLYLIGMPGHHIVSCKRALVLETKISSAVVSAPGAG